MQVPAGVLDSIFKISCELMSSLLASPHTLLHSTRALHGAQTLHTTIVRPRATRPSQHTGIHGKMIEIIVNDRLGKKLRIKASPQDTIAELKMVIAAASGTKPEKIVLKKWYTVYKDHITLEDYEIHDGMSLEMYYQ